jgi:hypothetical protein
MKNLHLISTNKPSRLTLNKKGLFLQKYIYENEISKSFGLKNQHIYITNDEEIKEGDYVYDIFKNACPVIRQLKTEEEVLGVQETEFKIILTTDQDLIKDGVQAIDDEFLEWFVKNPSCEFVKVEKRYSDFTVDPFVGYKIIIPQEKAKQETLEEAANKLFGSLKTGIGAERRAIWMNGAKFQQEQDKNKYSEEEVLDIINSFEKLCYNYQNNKDWFPAKKSEWFEQFKKK